MVAHPTVEHVPILPKSVTNSMCKRAALHVLHKDLLQAKCITIQLLSLYSGFIQEIIPVYSMFTYSISDSIIRKMLGNMVCTTQWRLIILDLVNLFILKVKYIIILNHIIDGEWVMER